MIYLGRQVVLDREQLHRISVPRRSDVSNRWAGVQHGVLADTIVEELKRRHLKIVNETWYCNPTQTDLFGAIDVRPVTQSLKNRLSLAGIGQGADFSVGVRHSNCGRYSISLIAGARITVCANGMFSGEIFFRRKHYAGVDLGEEVKRAVSRYLEECSLLASKVISMQCNFLTEEQPGLPELTMMEAVRREILGVQFLRTVDDLWTQPRHKEFEPRNSWSLYNAFTGAAREMSPPSQVKLLTGMQGLWEDHGLN